LEEEGGCLKVKDYKIQDAISFLRNRENLVLTLNEWTASARFQMERNFNSHPFSSVATPTVMTAALMFYGIILDSSFYEVCLCLNLLIFSFY
jgi:hypothetical protein